MGKWDIKSQTLKSWNFLITIFHFEQYFLLAKGLFLKRHVNLFFHVNLICKLIFVLFMVIKIWHVPFNICIKWNTSFEGRPSIFCSQVSPDYSEMLCELHWIAFPQKLKPLMSTCFAYFKMAYFEGTFSSH